MAINSARYSWKHFWSRAALAGERFWNAFWPAVSLALFYAGLALLGAASGLSDKTHLAVLTAAVVSVWVAAKKLGEPFSFPTRAETDRAIEARSGLAHRPLETLQDELCQGAPELWEAHLKSRQKALSKLRVHLPRTTTARQDKYGLRHAAMMVFIIGLVVAGNASVARLKEGLTPRVAGIVKLSPAALDVWISPPEYTKAPTVFLTTAQLGVIPSEGAINVPTGSILKVRVAGMKYAPSFTFAGKSAEFTKAADRSFTLEYPLTESGEIKITKWLVKTLGEWPVYIIPDTPPKIEFLMSEKTPQAALKISYMAEDDYAVARITATFTPLPELEAKIGTKTYSFPIPLSASTKDVLTHTEDLASHILAGNTVMMTLAAEDNAGNVTVTEEKSVLLPEREFTNPAAKRIIEERKRLLWFNNRVTQRIVMDHLAEIANTPAAYKGDPIIFMGLVMAVKRLGYDGDDESVESVQALLWDLALKIEDGGLSMAARELQEALQELSEALADPETPDAKIQELTQNVQRKMYEYMKALANEMQQRMAEGKNTPTIPPELADKFMKHIDMGELMKQLQEMSKGNSREQMRKMAEMMRDSLQNLDMQKLDEMQKGQQKAMEALQKMQDIIEKQQSLMDRTGKKKPGEQCTGEAQEQQGLRDRLGEAMRDMAEFMPELPENLGNADQAMKEAQRALSENKPQDALGPQKKALEELQKGMDQSMAQMAQQMKQMILSFGMMPRGNNYGEGYDPLGREDGQQQADGDIVIPDEAERRRVQEIIKTLRDRSNEFDRSKVEREYIERLLEMFY